jgi:hypothetical protein
VTKLYICRHADKTNEACTECPGSKPHNWMPMCGDPGKCDVVSSYGDNPAYDGPNCTEVLNWRSKSNRRSILILEE